MNKKRKEKEHLHFTSDVIDRQRKKAVFMVRAGQDRTGQDRERTRNNNRNFKFKTWWLAVKMPESTTRKARSTMQEQRSTLIWHNHNIRSRHSVTSKSVFSFSSQQTAPFCLPTQITSHIILPSITF